MKISCVSAPKGRPREFDVDEALAAALRVFWTKGYEAASLTDLTEAMGITRPSLYAAFGNKEALFCKALDLYEREKLAYVSVALDAPTLKGVAQRMLEGSLEIQTSGCNPQGCLGVISSISCVIEAESIRNEVNARRACSKRALMARFERGRAEGDVAADTDIEGLAACLMAVLQGMAVQGGAGASKADLRRLVDTSLAMWPGR